MIDIFDDETIGMPETSLAANGRRLNRLQLLDACLLQHIKNRLQDFHLDGQARRFERTPLLGWPSDDQHRQVLRGNGGKFKPRLGIREAQSFLAAEQRPVKGAGTVERVRVDKYAGIGFQNHRRLHNLRPSWRSYAAIASVASVLALVAPPASAQWIVFDPTNFSQNVLTAARELQQINNEIQSLTNEAQMLVNQARNLTSLPMSTLQQLESSVQQTQNLLSLAQNIAFNVQQIETAFSSTYGSVSTTASDASLIANAQTRWENSVGGFEDSLKVQAGVVGNIPSNSSAMSSLVSASQSATGALQAAQAGNQLLALQSQQLSDVVAVIAAKGRADALQQAEDATTEAQGQEQYRRFSKRSGYVPHDITMFGSN